MIATLYLIGCRITKGSVLNYFFDVALSSKKRRRNKPDIETLIWEITEVNLDINNASCKMFYITSKYLDITVFLAFKTIFNDLSYIYNNYMHDKIQQLYSHVLKFSNSFFPDKLNKKRYCGGRLHKSWFGRYKMNVCTVSDYG